VEGQLGEAARHHPRREDGAAPQADEDESQTASHQGGGESDRESGATARHPESGATARDPESSATAGQVKSEWNAYAPARHRIEGKDDGADVSRR
jgi:hypothetical protein